MGTDADDIIDIYERHAGAWVRARLQERGLHGLYERGWLDRFCELVSPGRAVLDLGCGAGQPIAAYLIERGFSVTGVDSSKDHDRNVPSASPRQEALISDMRTLALRRSFHGVLAWDSFFHLDHDSQKRMFPIFRAHAAPRAALMFTSGPAHGEGIGRLRYCGRAAHVIRTAVHDPERS